jgi:hypothetical protein
MEIVSRQQCREDLRKNTMMTLIIRKSKSMSVLMIRLMRVQVVELGRSPRYDVAESILS